jgi:hypothetical protein
MEYKKMTSKELKNLAKERGLPAYNNLNLTSLVRIHEEYDEAVKKSSEEEEEQISDENRYNDLIENPKEYKLIMKDGSDITVPILKDGTVNATKLCQAGGKDFKEYCKLKQTKLFLELFNCIQKVIKWKYNLIINIYKIYLSRCIKFFFLFYYQTIQKLIFPNKI